MRESPPLSPVTISIIQHVGVCQLSCWEKLNTDHYRGGGRQGRRWALWEARRSGVQYQTKARLLLCQRRAQSWRDWSSNHYYTSLMGYLDEKKGKTVCWGRDPNHQGLQIIRPHRQCLSIISCDNTPLRETIKTDASCNLIFPFCCSNWFERCWIIYLRSNNLTKKKHTNLVFVVEEHDHNNLFV